MRTRSRPAGRKRSNADHEVRISGAALIEDVLGEQVLSGENCAALVAWAKNISALKLLETMQQDEHQAFPTIPITRKTLSSIVGAAPIETLLGSPPWRAGRGGLTAGVAAQSAAYHRLCATTVRTSPRIEVGRLVCPPPR